MSHDLEDILIVLDGRPALPQEASTAPSDVRAFIAGRFRDLLGDSTFVNALPGLIRQEGREAVVLDRIEAIGRLTA